MHPSGASSGHGIVGASARQGERCLEPTRRSRLPIVGSVNRSLRWSPRPTVTATSWRSTLIATIPSLVALRHARARRSARAPQPDPNRLNHPLRRTNPKSEPAGEFEPVTWDEAFADIGERLRQIRRSTAPRRSAATGQPARAYTSPGILTIYTFWGKMQSTRLGGLTQDLSNNGSDGRVVRVEAMFPAPDLYHTDYFLCLGSDSSGKSPLPQCRCPTRSRRSAASAQTWR